jgi:hypothetical protein
MSLANTPKIKNKIVILAKSIQLAFGTMSKLIYTKNWLQE